MNVNIDKEDRIPRALECYLLLNDFFLYSPYQQLFHVKSFCWLFFPSSSFFCHPAFNCSLSFFLSLIHLTDKQVDKFFLFIFENDDFSMENAKRKNKITKEFNDQ